MSDILDKIAEHKKARDGAQETLDKAQKGLDEHRKEFWDLVGNGPITSFGSRLSFPWWGWFALGALPFLPVLFMNLSAFFLCLLGVAGLAGVVWYFR